LPPSESLETFLKRSQIHFREKTEHDLIARKRVIDLKRQFEILTRQRFPGLRIIWLDRHAGPLRVLLRTYSGDALNQMIVEYIAQPIYYATGISFDGFYTQAKNIATVLADRKYREQHVARRKLISEVPDSPDDTKAFQDSPFFKKLPRIFQTHIRQGGM
jgi:hypothetical protein